MNASPLSLLRQWMRREGIAAFVVPTLDPHNSEYLDPHFATRAFLTGFDGSAGTAVVTLTRAALWTDSRYFLQAERQLAGSGFELMREGEADTPSVGEWMAAEDSSLVGWMTAATATPAFMESLAGNSKVHFEATSADPFDEIWESRPPMTLRPIVGQPLEWAGERIGDKLQRLRSLLTAQFGTSESPTALVLNDLSEIAWLLNLRGEDIPYNPVFHAFFLLLDEGGVLCCGSERLDAAATASLEAADIAVAAYDDILPVIETLQADGMAWYVPTTINLQIKQTLEAGSDRITYTESPVPALRAIKNEAEIAGFRKAMERDGVAMVRFRRWLDEQHAAGTLGSLTEADIDTRLTAFRAEGENFRGLSFATIAGYAANGAIVHYEATPSTAASLAPRGLLLLDSGAQYGDGTTDITRTIALGETTEEERRVYTLVLKGHIGLSLLRFPDGTTGLQLDTAARQAMWAEGFDFGHGTGHGVGAFLCVHEGPQQIRKNLRGCTMVPFRAGMTITNEPGIYVSGRFGVRIENTLLVTDGGTTPFGRFLRFEPLTLCPIDTEPIETSLLTPAETAWLNDYHALVRRRLLPLLSDAADRAWLENATASLKTE